MKYNKLGSKDVSVICLGTMTFGEQNSESEGHEQLSYALDKGVNFIDTAEMYSVPAREETQGSTERIIGSWIKSQKREDIVLATKASGPAAWNDYLRGGPNYTKEQLTKALNDSLARLETDYVDLYQLHWPERKTNYFGQLDYKHDVNDAWGDNMHEVLESLQGFVKEGKVNMIGLSNETPWGLHRFLSIADKYDLPRIKSVQNPYSLLNRIYEVGMAEMSIREEAGLLAYSPLGFGMLTGKYIDQSPEKGRLTLYPKMARYSNVQCENATLQYAEIAKKHDLSFAQMSLAFINQQPFVTSNIIGATTMDQLIENIGSADIVLSTEVIEEINNVHGLIPNPAP